MSAALKFKTSQVPRQEGERARLKVVRGPDHGAIYVLTQPRATIGRGEESDVVLSDLKASREHAELFLVQDGTWKVRDLKSANGILLNGKAATQATLKQQDTLAIGESVLQFLTSDQATGMLVAPVQDLRQIQADQKNLEEQQKKIRLLNVVGGKKDLGAVFRSTGTTSNSPKGQNNSRKIILYALVGILAFMLLNEDSEKSQGKKGAKSSSNVQGAGGGTGTGQKEDSPRVINLKEFLPESGPAVINQTTQNLMKTGLREYWQGNWLRAKLQFETVLQITPNHALARRYLQNCENQINAEVKGHLETGKKAFATGKLKSARGHFEAVLRLLYRDPQNENYLTAQDQLDKVINETKQGGPAEEPEEGTR